MLIEFKLNSSQVSLETNPYKKLVYILRIDFGLTGTKLGCGTGQCGSCLVFMNDELVNSCLIPAFRLQGSSIVTIEGFSRTKEYNQLENALAANGVSLCGFCAPGIIMAVAALLRNTTHPTTDEIKEALTGNSCRCIGYSSLIQGIKKAARLRRKVNYGRKK